MCGNCCKGLACMRNSSTKDRRLLTSKDIEDHFRTSYGYGNLNSKCWLIGMEQRCGGKDRKLSRNIEIRISSYGHEPIKDLKKYHLTIGEYRLFRAKRPNLPRTWSKIIHFLIGFKGAPFPTDKEVRVYQKTQLGGKSGDNCLLELLPLACPSTKGKDWPAIYRRWGKQYPTLSFLKERESYVHALLPRRTQEIRKLLAQRLRSTAHCPNVVLFYGKSLNNSWIEIAGGALPRNWKNKVRYDRKGRTWFAATNHLTSRGSLTKKECYKLGKFFASHSS